MILTACGSSGGDSSNESLGEGKTTPVSNVTPPETVVQPKSTPVQSESVPAQPESVPAQPKSTPVQPKSTPVQPGSRTTTPSPRVTPPSPRVDPPTENTTTPNVSTNTNVDDIRPEIPNFSPTTWPVAPSPLPSVHRQGNLTAYSFGIWNTPFGNNQRYITSEILSRNNEFNPNFNNRDFHYPAVDKDIVAHYTLENGFEGEYFYNGQDGPIRADVRITASFPRNGENARVWGEIKRLALCSPCSAPGAAQDWANSDPFNIGNENFGGIVLNNGVINSNGVFTGTAALFRNVVPGSGQGIMTGSFSSGNKTVVNGVDVPKKPDHVAGEILITGFMADNPHHPEVDPNIRRADDYTPENPKYEYINDPAKNAITGVFVANVED